MKRKLLLFSGLLCFTGYACEKKNDNILFVDECNERFVRTIGYANQNKEDVCLDVYIYKKDGKIVTKKKKVDDKTFIDILEKLYKISGKVQK